MARSAAKAKINGAHHAQVNKDGRRVAHGKAATATRVTLIPGDGVGPEVISAAVKVIEAAGVRIDWDQQLGGAIALRRFGTPVPDQLIDSLKANGVALKGPLETRVGEGYRSINVYLRKLFELYANVRPVRSQAGVHTPFSGVDIIVIRENTEDLYAGIEHQVAPGVVESVKIITARASTRIARFAFEYARTNHRHLVTAIHKANIMKLSDGLFLKCAQRVAREYHDVEYQEQIVDAACMRLVTDPRAFDVLLLENLYGDIVSDLCAGLVGGLGFVPGANYGKHGAIFETVHGTAPDIAGKGIANPVAAIKTGALLLDYLGRDRAGDRIRAAVNAVLRAGRVVTPDIGGKAGTADMTAAVIRALK
jgi:isocitrate dehydrogenase (NAD+)